MYDRGVRDMLKSHNELANQLEEKRLAYAQLKNIRKKEKRKMREEG